MSKLLISIRSLREAELVKFAEIGILDVKEPNRGGLGASDPATLQEIAEDVGRSDLGQALSFSAGELRQWGQSLTGQVSSRSLLQVYSQELLSRFSYVKVGMAGTSSSQGSGLAEGFSAHDSKPEFDWRNRWVRLFDDLPATTRSVAVVYVDFRDCDAPSPSEVIQLAAQTGHCGAVLFDTYYKSGNLFSHVSITELNQMVRSVRAQGLVAVVAGSVGLDCLADVVSLSPDYVAVRGAVCRGTRAGEIAPDLVEKFAEQLRVVIAN